MFFFIISGVYLTIIMAMSALSVVFSVFVLNFHHKTAAATPPPAWIKGVALIASYLTCSRVNFSESFPGNTVVNDYNIGSNHYHETTTQSGFHECQINSFEDVDVCQSLLQRQTDSKSQRCNSGNCNGTVIIDNQSPNSKSITVLEKVMLDYVTKVLSSYDKRAHESRTLQDWREIARVIDRLFFILFLLITIISTIVILLVCPLMKNITIDNEVNKV